MAVRREYPTIVPSYRGINIYQLTNAQVMTPAVGGSVYVELDSVQNMSEFRCLLVFVNITAIAGTWTIRPVTRMRLASFTVRHVILNSLSVAGRTTTGMIEVGYNCYSGANTLVADLVEVEFLKTAGLVGDSITVTSDALFYN